MSDGRRAFPPTLEVKGLDVYFGHSHALLGVNLSLDSGLFSVVGRNCMG
jgi:ABC-type branched-subunit amino acid transport system ATPase component